MTGTFVAFLSTSTTDARDRLAGARGWVRPDGAPFADTFAELIAGEEFSALVVDETGAVVPAGSVQAWTGSLQDGTRATDTCNDWTAGTVIGRVGEVGAGIGTMFQGAAALNCQMSDERLYCFEIDHVAVVGPQQTTGRTVFVSSPIAVGGGLAALDGQCQSDATAAVLAGTFRAAVATTSASAQSRFAMDTTPWVRPDGTLVAHVASALFDGSDLLALVDQTAAGAYMQESLLWTGGAPGAPGVVSSTCNDWTDNGAAAALGTSDAILSSLRWSSVASYPCSQPASVLCLEQ